MAARPILQAVQVPGDALLALHARRPDRYPALFESAVAGSGPVGSGLARFDILFACPGQRLTLHRDGSLSGPPGVTRERFLDSLDAWCAATPAHPADTRAPFSGGWLLYLSYELAGEIEPRLRLPRLQQGPIAQAIRIPAAVIRERESGQAWIVAEAHEAAHLATIAADIAEITARGEGVQLSAAGDASQGDAPLIEGDVREDDPEAYLHAVERALEYIAAGDVYQANLSREWRARLRQDVAAWRIYERIRHTNPGPFSGIVAIEDIVVVSSSPERLVEVREGRISTRPIAGTRPRGATADADRALAHELHAHPKERAEHVMLIDLERNDLGRVCQAGSVRVDEFMTIESYAHVHHIVSNVSGALRADATVGQALAAVFPGGTITGCPKVRCMEIIAELEGCARGAYTGSLGYLSLDGALDMNILIRTLEVRGREVRLRAGAGVVADSDPQRELAETRAKARGVLRALGVEAAA